MINDISIIEPGVGYRNTDRVIDISRDGFVPVPGSTADIPENIQYQIQVGNNGEIIKVSPINSQLNNVIEVKELPVFKVISETGYGAKLKAILKQRQDYQGPVKQQIDCISK